MRSLARALAQGLRRSFGEGDGGAIDGLVTGWHEPQASHLQMLVAIAGDELLGRSYDEALERGYLWHEFGDSHLILASRTGAWPHR
jgi:S-adenosylmethionine:tRNA-ribosyltransferase-isomerase (queuine synthetase)